MRACWQAPSREVRVAAGQTDGPTLIMSVARARVHACIGRLHVVSAAAAAGSFDMPRPCVVHAHPLPPPTTTKTDYMRMEALCVRCK